MVSNNRRSSIHCFVELLEVMLSRFHCLVVQITTVYTTGVPTHLSMEPQLQNILFDCPAHRASSRTNMDISTVFPNIVNVPEDVEAVATNIPFQFVCLQIQPKFIIFMLF